MHNTVLVTATSAPTLHDCAPSRETFRAEVLAGLAEGRKTLPCKYFYDAHGSQLFDQICDLPEYYPTRTEAGIMRDQVALMAAAVGPDSLLIEYGSGSSTKTRILLDHLPDLAGYVPMDISGEHLTRSAQNLAAEYPNLGIHPVCADYTADFELPEVRARRSVVYFPGSTIGNFHPREARAFLARVAQVCGPDGGLLIGVDLKKPPQVLEPAYNDRRGVTAAFNLNLLTRINRELGADFDLDGFAHLAFYNPFAGRVEMHLVSGRDQTVRIGNVEIAFEEDETIHTECSYKYSLEEFARLARRAGLAVRQVWTDQNGWFSVQYLTVCPDGPSVP